MNAMAGEGSARITQLMSLSHEEFLKSILALDAGAHAESPVCYRLDATPGHVTISYSPRPGVTLGGLLALPRAEVTIEFTGMSTAEQSAFQRRFDMAFQRGGG